MVIEVLMLACMANALLMLSVILLIRLCNHRMTTMESAVGQDDWDCEILQALRQTLLSLAEPAMSSSGRYMPLTTKISKVEEADRDQNLQTLLAQISSDCKSAFNGDIKLANLEQFVKSVYRLQAPYEFDDALMANIFAVTIERVKGSVLLAKTVDRVELVKTNARVDEKTMWPLNPGLRVKQTFGMVLKTEAGEVLSRAKAHCH